jgi:ribokinase
MAAASQRQYAAILRHCIGAQMKSHRTIISLGSINADFQVRAERWTPNSVEAQRLTGIAVQAVADALRAGRALISRGAKVALMKMAQGGCVAVTADNAVLIRPTPVKVVDTTGAGDMFAGALAVALLEGRSLADGVRFAVAAANVSVTRYGAQASYPDRREVDKMLALLPPNEQIA